jgi:hypothetical protein
MRWSWGSWFNFLRSCRLGRPSWRFGRDRLCCRAQGGCRWGSRDNSTCGNDRLVFQETHKVAEDAWASTLVARDTFSGQGTCSCWFSTYKLYLASCSPLGFWWQRLTEAAWGSKIGRWTILQHRDWVCWASGEKVVLYHTSPAWWAEIGADKSLSATCCGSESVLILKPAWTGYLHCAYGKFTLRTVPVSGRHW